MKKSILTFLLCLSSIVVAFAQNYNNTYLQAKFLNSVFSESTLKDSPTNQCIKGEILVSILGNDYENTYSDNPFLQKDEKGKGFIGFKSFLNKYCIEYEKIEFPKTKPGDVQAIEMSNIFSLPSPRQSMDSRSSSNWQTAILQGTADFMAQRFKDELTNFALNSFLNELNQKDNLKFKILFPRTLSYVDSYLEPNSNKGYFYSDLNMLKYSAELDLENIIFQLPEFTDNIKHPNDNSKLFSFTTKVITRKKGHKDPIEIFNALKNLDSVDTELKEKLDVLAVFNNALRSEDENENYWVEWSKIDPSLIETDLTVRFFYALLYEQTKNLKDLTDRFIREKLVRKTKKAANTFQSIESSFQAYNEDESNMSISEYKNIILPVLKTIDEYTTDETLKLELLSTNLIEIHESIIKKEYRYILPNLVYLFNDLQLENKIIDREFLKNLSLLIDFTIAQNSEDVKALLNTYALPIGSSSLKRTGKSDLSFNGYVGLTGGYEFADSGTNNSFFNLGLTAPIGLSLSHRYNSKTFISSGSIFLGFIDLGSLVNNSFDDNIEIQSDLSFQQFFVPSLGYFFNIKNSPFSFGMVGSYHFDSRALVNSPEADGIDVFRLNLSLLVDIPFFTLSHKN